MPQTVTTSATAYVTASDLFVYCDWTLIADALRDDDGPRPSKAALTETDPTKSDVGSRLATLCLAASGDLLAACQARGLYTPADIDALTGATAAHRDAVTAGLTLARVFERRWPGTGKPDDLPAVVRAQETLEQLRVGERVFGLQENIDAGKGLDTLPLNATGVTSGRTVSQSQRFFGYRGRSWGGWSTPGECH